MKRTMARCALLVGLACSLVLVTGCTEKEKKGAVVGVGLGALGGGLLGGLIGKGAGSAAAGAAIGAGLGALGGGAIGAAANKEEDAECRSCEKAHCCKWRKEKACSSGRCHREVVTATPDAPAPQGEV